jgi:hypothetical protein
MMICEQAFDECENFSAFAPLEGSRECRFHFLNVAADTFRIRPPLFLRRVFHHLKEYCSFIEP